MAQRSGVTRVLPFPQRIAPRLFRRHASARAPSAFDFRQMRRSAGENLPQRGVIGGRRREAIFFPQRFRCTEQPGGSRLLARMVSCAGRRAGAQGRRGAGRRAQGAGRRGASERVAHGAITCSQLSNTSNSRRDRKKSESVAASGRSDFWRTFNARRHRFRDKTGIVDRGKFDQPKAVGVLIENVRRDLQREARFSGPTWPGEREEMCCRQKPAHLSDLAFASDEAGELHRQIVGDALQRPECRKLRGQIGRRYLEQVLGTRQIAKAHRAQFAQRFRRYR